MGHGDGGGGGGGHPSHTHTETNAHTNTHRPGAPMRVQEAHHWDEVERGGRREDGEKKKKREERGVKVDLSAAWPRPVVTMGHPLLR